MNNKWLVFIFSGKSFIGTMAGKKLSVEKTRNKALDNAYLGNYSCRCKMIFFFASVAECLGRELSVHPSPLSFSADVFPPETAIATVTGEG